MKSPVDSTLQKHQELVHCALMQVNSHVQRFNGECVLNTLMMDGYDCPFKYCRDYKYQNLEGKQVELSYYPAIELIAGLEVDIMKVVQIKAI